MFNGSVPVWLAFSFLVAGAPNAAHACTVAASDAVSNPSAPPANATATAQVAAAGERRTRIGLSKLQGDASFVSFGLPLAPDTLSDPAKVQVFVYPSNALVSGVKTRPLLRYYDQGGNPTSIRSLLIQFPASAMSGVNMTIDVIVNSSAGAETTYHYFPMFSISAELNTGVAVANLSGRTANPVFRAYDDNGGLLASAQRQLAERGQLALELGELLPTLKAATGWLEMDSDAPNVEGLFRGELHAAAGLLCAVRHNSR